MLFFLNSTIMAKEIIMHIYVRNYFEMKEITLVDVALLGF